MPLIVKDSVIRLVIVNLAPTTYDSYGDVVINEKSGEALSQILEWVKVRLKA